MDGRIGGGGGKKISSNDVTLDPRLFFFFCRFLLASTPERDVNRANVA